MLKSREEIYRQLEGALRGLPSGPVQFKEGFCSCCGVRVYCDHDEEGEEEVGATLGRDYLGEALFFETVSTDLEGEQLNVEHLPELDLDETPCACLTCVNTWEKQGELLAIAARAHNLPNRLALELYKNAEHLVVEGFDLSDPWFLVSEPSVRGYWFTAYDPCDGTDAPEWKTLHYLLENQPADYIPAGFWTEDEEEYALDTLGLMRGEELEYFQKWHEDHTPVNGGQGYLSNEFLPTEYELEDF